MISAQKAVDASIGVSVLGWATLGTWSNLGERPLAVLASISLLHGMVGSLFLIRSQASLQGNLSTCLTAAPAVLVGGWVFQLAPQQWNAASQMLFVAGSGLALLSFAFLGRRFAVLPAFRGAVMGGPYAYVRHPAYLGELGMIVACLLAMPLEWSQLIVLLVALTFFVARIHVEERLLMTVADYRRYCQRVRWRLVPCLW